MVMMPAFLVFNEVASTWIGLRDLPDVALQALNGLKRQRPVELLERCGFFVLRWATQPCIATGTIRPGKAGRTC
jgi:hypothetical protein